jgi:hypothetical protein
MQNMGYRNGSLVSSISILLLCNVLVLVTGCGNKVKDMGLHNNDDSNPQVTVAEVNPGLVRYTTFQNLDSTWGYTVFVNSRPYLRTVKMPFKRATTGFRTREDAEVVADLVVKMIKKGDFAPKLDKKVLDSLNLILSEKEETGK